MGTRNLNLIEDAKTCSRCRETKALESFSNNPKSKDQKRGICRDCDAASARLRHARYLSNGVCSQCRKPHDGDGVCCPECLTKAKYRYVDRDPNICFYCHSAELVTSLYCETCWLKEVSWRFLKSRRRGDELKALMTRQSYRCALSGVQLRLGLNASIDHIIPKSLGGEDSIENYRWVHTRVNRIRGNLSDAELYDLCSLVADTLSNQKSCGRDSTWMETYKNGIY